MRRKTISEGRKKPSMSNEFTAPAVLQQMRDMIGEAGRLLAPGAAGETQRAAIERASERFGWRLTAGRAKRIVYDEVKSVPKHEYEWVNHWLNTLRQRLGTLEKNYNEARRELLEGGPALARLAPPEIVEVADRPAVDPETNARLLRAFDAQKRRIAPWGGR